jgi:hypothetical protein
MEDSLKRKLRDALDRARLKEDGVSEGNNFNSSQRAINNAVSEAVNGREYISRTKIQFFILFSTIPVISFPNSVVSIIYSSCYLVVMIHH